MSHDMAADAELLPRLRSESRASGGEAVHASRMLTIADMPHYPVEFHELIAATLAQLRPDRVLFTYSAPFMRLAVSRLPLASTTRSTFKTSRGRMSSIC